MIYFDETTLNANLQYEQYIYITYLIIYFSTSEHGG